MTKNTESLSEKVCASKDPSSTSLSSQQNMVDVLNGEKEIGVS